MTIRAAIVGPTGYTGLYLIQVLLRHPSAKITYLASHREQAPVISEVFPQLLGRCDLPCRAIDYRAIAGQADVVFCCLPHATAMEHVPHLLAAGLRVVDLSADYRLRDAELYQSVYQHAHSDRRNLASAVYGLPELFADAIPSARLVANPGCYPTAAALAVAPLLERGLVSGENIIINAASGVSGAGRAPKQEYHFPEVNENFWPYAPGVHRHQPEIEQALSTVAGHEVSALFVPHLLPIDRGILETIYLEPKDAGVTQDDLQEALIDAYDAQPFVRVRTDLPSVKAVRDTNYCDIAVRVARGGRGAGRPRVVVFSAIDNMIKGASGQAVQNMNLMFNLDQATGLTDGPGPHSRAAAVTAD